MKLRTKAAAYGVAGLVVAGTVLFSGSALGLLNTDSSGVLSVLLTDPPTVPDGVSAVYISYSSIAVHAAGLNDSGWISFSGGGTIDTMKLVNLSQTISSETVPSFTYNLVEFNVSKVDVDYMGVNYSASVASTRLVVPIVGGVKVSSSNPAAALIDIYPVVLNLGDQANPSFTIATGAKALQVPSVEVSDSMKKVGNSYSLEGHGWFQTFRKVHSSNVTVQDPALAPGAFSFTVTNLGTDPVTVRMIILTPVAHGGGLTMAMNSMANSIFFSAQSDGSLRLVNGTPDQVESALSASGYLLAPGSSHSFTFSGTIASLLGKQAVSSGVEYNMVLMGSEALSAQTVVTS